VFPLKTLHETACFRALYYQSSLNIEGSITQLSLYSQFSFSTVD